MQIPLSFLNKEKSQGGAILSGFMDKTDSDVMAKVEKHLDVLHYRNSLVRNAILADSAEDVKRRHAQFVTVLRSYVRLLVLELHGTIAQSMNIANDTKYMEIRKETFDGYQDLIMRSDVTCEEMLHSGTDYAREFFKMELQVKKYFELEQEYIYPLYHKACAQI